MLYLSFIYFHYYYLFLLFIIYLFIFTIYLLYLLLFYIYFYYYLLLYYLLFILLYRVSDNFLHTQSVQVERVKLNRKVFCCFVIFAVINEKLINNDRGFSTRDSSTFNSSKITRHPVYIIYI